MGTGWWGQTGNCSKPTPLSHQHHLPLAPQETLSTRNRGKVSNTIVAPNWQAGSWGGAGSSSRGQLGAKARLRAQKGQASPSPHPEARAGTRTKTIVW